MQYLATYLVIGQGPKYLKFDTETYGKDNVQNEAWRRAAVKEGVNPEKNELLDCSPSR